VEDLVPLQQRVSVYPNPTNGNVYIQTPKNDESLHLRVRNIQGQLVQSQVYSNQSTIDFTIEGKSGVYILELTNEKGERANLKIIKQ